ncbi:MAG: hypothetical protein ABIV21_02970 [Pyrinomonadaceae bacterium]
MIREDVAAFIDDIKGTHGKNLASVILYGPAAAGDYVQDRSDYNILIALHKLGPKDLRNAHGAMREWHRMGHPIPVYFTVSELANAADVFPIEFSKMEAARTVLYGTDVLSGLEFSDKNLRHQTEYELRSRLVKLRRQYIRVSTSADRLKELMASSLPSFTNLFAAALMLVGIDPPSTKREIVALTAHNLGIKGRPFEKILNIHENNFTEDLDETAANDLFGDYMEQIENVIDAVDAIEEK